MITSTTQLILRELTEDDKQHFYDLNLDPDVLQYTGDSVFESVEASRLFLVNYQDVYKRYGFGRWAVMRTEDDAFLGWCGLKYSEDTGQVDLGFRLFKKYWGNGYATEAAQACVVLAFEKFSVQTLVGRAMRANGASIRVLEKLGFVFREFFDFEGKEGVIYSMKK
ncbi:GNAT family N-acetyltransferase [Flavobacterium sp. Sd200]|uniref:GNAT family N-acetyltransferase n=1 Tax=Flavobacterium sp. Sd200 TaxID=2692211 RepID=UPI00136D35D5|nr:GNAT family N-acetyltransferase [Flavobacterium sp. Sd200]MXN92021.1 GNAT family N-acetyltransferase [Flavobacterium sp. Sd200]